MRSFLILALSSVVISGCVTTEPYIIKSKLDPVEMSKFTAQSTTKITGQAFLKTRGGDVKFGAGADVFLYPSVSYSREINSAPQFSQIQGRDSEWGKYIKSTTADGHGNFEFNNISAGQYFIETNITWQVPGKYGSTTTGGLVRKTIDVPKDGTLKVILTE
jgi:hypothetical protein